MELIYIYIENDGKNIKNCEFNFSPEYLISYDAKEHFITINSNEKFIPNFWEVGNISNVTAIIGKNGTGKSNLIDFIINTLCGQRGGIVIWRYKGILYRSKHHNRINSNVSIREQSFWGSPFNNLVENCDKVSDSMVVYFSPNIDRSITVTNSLYQFKDISNAASLRLKKRYRSQENTIAGISDVDYMQLIDTLKQLLFFSYSQDVFLPKDIRLPEYLNITLYAYDIVHKNHPVYQKLTNSLNNTFEGQLQGILIKQFFSIKDLPSSLGNHTVFEDILAYMAINVSERPTLYDELIELYNKKCIIYDPEWQKSLGEWDKFSFSIKRIVLDNKIVTALLSYYFDEEPSFASFTTIDFHQGLVNRGISIQWDGLSSGELSFYNLLARINSVLTELNGEIYNQETHHLISHNRSNYRNFILILDEPELSFHPEWQQKFLNLILSTIGHLYPEFNFQIIIASHSPILVSDFPKDNIIFLDKNPDGTCKVIDSISRDNTFGANIHTLYRNSFFIDGLPIGEFAKKKINKLFDELENAATIRPTILKEIQLIGEPILREQLMKLYKQREGLSEEVNSRISQLQKEIEDLKRRLDDKN